MKPKATPPAEYLREILHYDPLTGDLTWRERGAHLFSSGKYSSVRRAAAWNRKNSGQPALAAPTSNGYLHGAIDNASFLAHRVIWKLITGVDAIEIDHINGTRSDNRFSNLRECSRPENMRNRSLSKNNRSGVIGVYARDGRWVAQIECDGVVNTLGTFPSLEDARTARLKAERLAGFHPNHGRLHNETRLSSQP